MLGVFFASLFASTVPIVMRLLGLIPPNGTGALFAIVFVFYLSPQSWGSADSSS